MKLKYKFEGHIKFKSKIPGVGKLDIDVKSLETEGELPDELMKDFLDKAYEAGFQLSKEMELGE